AVTWPAVAGAVTLTALTTLWSAWRWRVVARALDVDISLPVAIGAYYRSLFLNMVLRGGVGTAVRADHPGRRGRFGAADSAFAGSARAALRSGRSGLCRRMRGARR